MRSFIFVMAALSAGSAAAFEIELPTEPLPALPERVEATIDVYPREMVHEVSPQFLGTNVAQYALDKRQMANPEAIERVRALGVKTIRFPNGCYADLYNWQEPPPNEVTVDEFLDFCDAVGVEPYYTLNMQGGTEGLEGLPPEGAPVEEIIRYRHTAPNPCGQTNYYFGTLPEAIALVEKYTIQRALDGRTPILHYELGNENWGQARTDWPPLVYGKNAEVWARALRETLAAAQTRHPELGHLKLYIVAVGFPTMGNNQDPLQAVDRQINLAWTAEMNRLADLELIDAVTEHFYPFPSNYGDAVIWTAHNLHNIMALRYGQPSQRLDGYLDPDLAYTLPVEVTEWNIKCWGRNTPRFDLPVKNPGFEDGTDGWEIEVLPSEAAGKVTAMKGAARRGEKGLRLATTARGEAVEIRQKWPLKEDMFGAAAVGAAVWVKSPTPLQVNVILRQANEGENKGRQIDRRLATQTNMWERVIIGKKPFEDTREVELVIRLEGDDTHALIDEVQPRVWLVTHDNRPAAADTFEQQLFAVDAFREMLKWPIPRTHWHQLFGNGACSQITSESKNRYNAAPFLLLESRIGSRLVRAECDVPTFDFNTYADPWATDFNAVVPDTTGIPALSAVATRDDDQLYVLLVNRTTDRVVHARIRLHHAEARGDDGDCRILTGELDLPGYDLRTETLRLTDPLVRTVPPFSAQVLRIPLITVTPGAAGGRGAGGRR